MDFMDLASRYAQARFDRATDPFTDPEAYLSRRLGVDQEANVIPKSTTITNNEDGTQTITTKKELAPAEVQPQPQPAAQPAALQQPQIMPTPTPVPMPSAQPQPQPMAQPVQPSPITFSDIQGQETQRLERPLTPQPQPVAQPAPQPMPQAQAPLAPVQPQVPEMPQPAPQAVAQPAPMAPVAPVAQPAAAPAPQAAPQPQMQAPQPAPQAAPTPAPQPQYWGDQLLSIQNDPTKLAAFVGDTNNPEGARKLAADMWRANDVKQQDQSKADKLLQGVAEGDPRAVNQLARDLRKQSEEGSYVKAYLFQRLGLTDLAREEQQKLGAGANWQSMIGPDGQRYTAEVAGTGNIVRAYDTEGNRVDDKVIANLSAQGIGQKGATVHTQAYRDRDTGEIYWQRTAGGQAQLVNSKGQVFAGNPQSLYAYGIGSDIEQKNALQLQTLRNRLLNEPKIAAAKSLAEFNALNGTNYTYDQVISSQPALASTTPSGAPTTAAGAIGSDLSPSLQGKIVSAGRSTAQQQAIWDESVAAGRPGRTAQGMPIAKPGTSQHEVGNALDLPRNLSKAERTELASKGYYQPEGTDSVHWERIPGFQAPSTGAAPAGAPRVAPTAGIPSTAPETGISPKQMEANRAIQTKRSEAFNEIIDKEYRENAQKGDIISTNRKTQFQILDRNDPTTGKKVSEQISGLYNAANEDPTNQKWSIVRDILGGKFKPEAEVSQRLAQLNISPAVKSALTEYNALNAQIAGQTLRETAGPGSVSDAEQAANRARNVDITKTPMLGVYNMMGQSQFSGDLQRYKADLAASDQNKSTNATQFDRQFRGISTELTNAYRKIAESRLDYIQRNGSTPDAIREGYKKYPVPEYDPQTGNWKYLKPLNEIFGR